MKMLIEHTAFHGFEKTRTGVARSESDVANFLQICVQLIFSDELILSTSLPKEVIAKSEEIKNSASEFQGVFRVGLNDTPLHEGDLDKICTDVGTLVERTIAFNLEGYNNTMNFQEYMPILSPSQKNQFSLMTDAILEGNSETIVGELAGLSFARKDDGLLAYILSKNERLLQYVLKHAQENRWDFACTARLISEVRTQLNSQLAQFGGVIYSPSVNRAKDIKNVIKRIEEKVTDINKGYSSLTNGPQIKLPSFVETLLYHGKQDPQGVLEKTFEYRRLFQPLRVYLNEQSENYLLRGTYEHSANLKLNNLAVQLFSEVRNNGMNAADPLASAPVMNTQPVPGVFIKDRESVFQSVQAFTMASEESVASDHQNNFQRFKRRASQNLVQAEAADS